jgi:hypothetical protein
MWRGAGDRGRRRARRRKPDAELKNRDFFNGQLGKRVRTPVQVVRSSGLRNISEGSRDLIQPSSPKTLLPVAEVYGLKASGDGAHNPNTERGYVWGGQIHVCNPTSGVSKRLHTCGEIRFDIAVG